MRLGGTTATSMLLAATAFGLGGCGNAKKAQAQADEQARGFVPPSVMTRLDFGSAIERRFRQLDRNGDERITPDELPSRDSRLKSLDRNHDSAITATEWSEGMLQRFDRMDRNHDSSVTSVEREAMLNEQ